MRRTTEKDHPFNLCLPPESFYVGANIVKSFLQKPTPKYKITPRGWMVDGTDSSKRVLTQSNTQGCAAHMSLELHAWTKFIQLC